MLVDANSIAQKLWYLFTASAINRTQVS
jgi:hypothetical protein